MKHSAVAVAIASCACSCFEPSARFGGFVEQRDIKLQPLPARIDGDPSGKFEFCLSPSYDGAPVCFWSQIVGDALHLVGITTTGQSLYTHQYRCDRLETLAFECDLVVADSASQLSREIFLHVVMRGVQQGDDRYCGHVFGYGRIPEYVDLWGSVFEAVRTETFEEFMPSCH